MIQVEECGAIDDPLGLLELADAIRRKDIYECDALAYALGYLDGLCTAGEDLACSVGSVYCLLREIYRAGVGE